MLDQDDHDSTTTSEAPTGAGEAGATAPKARAPRKRAAKKAAAPAAETTTEATAQTTAEPASEPAPVTGDATPAAKKAAAPRKRTSTRKTAATAAPSSAPEAPTSAEPALAADRTDQPADGEAAPEKPKRAPRKRTAKAAAPASDEATDGAAGATGDDSAAATTTAVSSAVVAPLFQAPEPTTAPARRTRKTAAAEPAAESPAADGAADADDRDVAADDATGEDGESTARRKRRRGGRRRRKSGEPGESDQAGAESDESSDGTDDEAAPSADAASETPAAGEGESTSSRRRRRRRRSGDDGGDNGGDDPANTVTRVRSSRSANDEITAVSGSTRLEAKKQRRREGREAGRRRAPIVSEAEFLARRESVNRVMAIRQKGDITQIAVLEDNVLVEHYVARESQTSLIGNVYLGRVQNVLPSMEAAFIDIGKGRNAVLYAGEVNWSSLGHKEGQPRKIESVLSSGQMILVQVTKDPIGHKGARLTSQVSLAGRFLVYVPDGTTSGISRKLPDTERNRLKTLLKDIVPDTAGVIVRTAAEGAAEDELTRDVERLKARWEDIEKKAANKGSGAQLLYGEPDLTLKVVRDLFTEDFAKLVIEGDDAWETVQSYVVHVAPDLEERLERYDSTKGQDVFAAYRIEEQIKKGLDRKVWLPSGGSLVIDRTEAMTVVDVNTGKFTGSGGNLEETVTKNNLEAAEEIVRQLRLRDIGGIIVVDFIDMVLESNRDLVLRRLVECLGRDRTRHQVAEVTSLGLVQMTRKRIGTGLLESFSHDCPTCHGRGVVVEEAPVEPRQSEDEPRRGRRTRAKGGSQDTPAEPPAKPSAPSPKDIAAMARHERAEADAETPEAATGEPETPHPESTEPESTQPESTEPESTEPAEPVTESTDGAVEQTDGVVEVENAPETAVVPEPEVEAEATSQSEPEVEAEREPEPAPEAPAAPEPPRVVTRTRRRSASRPAGPPASGTPTDGTAADPGTGSDAVEPGDEGHALHVPVKRKGGARKR
ncbi:Rne/Rng family ribonuclease [Nocardioides cynanchi]|uniref:Rne/Rng family ribonuclease n=1 Tax=Nocardioides cynanchi TaxID=2558918 RepID=UPI001245A442|nr:Rne/Rng family ribonuclease [Nocardioides cynanchi]